MQLPIPVGPDPSLPSPVGPLSGLVFPTINGVPTKLAADVSSSNSVVPAACGFNLPVVAGVPITVRFRAWIITGNIGGAVIRFVHPGVTSGIVHSRQNTTATSVITDGNITSVSGSPMIIFGAFATYTGQAIFDVFMSYIPSASGTIDFTIAPNTNGQLMTLKAGSYVEVIA